MVLHPYHLADLRRSGLTDETIQAAGIYSVRPADIGKKLGGAETGVVSLLAFSNPGCDGYERYKVWYEEGREKDSKGKPRSKYRQPKESPNRLYVPPGVDLQGSSLLLISEGEKKVLALMQAGCQAVGLGGVFNWLTKGEGEKSNPIADLDLVNWQRPVVIVFDSDGTENSKVRLAAFRLARELSQRGAEVKILFLPSGSAGGKQGADDLLVAHGAQGPEVLKELLATAWTPDPSWNDAETEIWWQLRSVGPDSGTFDKLKALCGLSPLIARLSNLETATLLESIRERLKLRRKDLADLERDIKRERKALESRGKGERQAPKLEEIEEARRLHPAIDFVNGHMTLGFRIPLQDGEDGLLLFISDAQAVRVEMNPETVWLGDQVYRITEWQAVPRVEDVWSLAQLKAFYERPTKPDALYAQIKETLRCYLDLPEEIYGLLAAWILGTYFAHLFGAFPFINPSGPKETGKSKTLEALRFICFNGWKGRDITAAALGDTVDGMRGTVLIDQAEKLTHDNETNLVGLLADSYKKAGGLRRVVEMSKNGRRILEFSTYGPKAFASTKRLDPDLADRCIRIPMTRTRKRLPDLEGWEPVWKELRDACYRFTLTAFKKVAQAYQNTPGDGTRIGELWRPLGAVLKVLQVAEDEVASIKELFTVQAQETRHEPTGWELTLLQVLKERTECEVEPFGLGADEIIEAMAIEGEHKPGAKWVGNTLSQYNLHIQKNLGAVGL